MTHSIKQKAIITGATGFVGCHLTKHLIDEGWQVAIIIRPSSNLELLQTVIKDITIYCHDGSTANMISIMDEAKPEVVFHLASSVISQHQSRDIHTLINSNILFGTQLVEAMVENKIYHLVNTGTSWQHYQNQPYNPVSLYAATKQAYESILKYYVEVSPLQVVNLKLFDTYGSNDPRSKLISLLLDAARTGKAIDLSPGEQLIDIVHVKDVVQAFTIAANLMLVNQLTQWEEFAVSSGTPIRLKDLVETIETVLGKSLPVNWGKRSYRPREVMTPWNNGKKLPLWQPEITLEEGIREMVSN